MQIRRKASLYPPYPLLLSWVILVSPDAAEPKIGFGKESFLQRDKRNPSFLWGTVWATPPQGSLLIIVITVVVINAAIIPFLASYLTLPRSFFIANISYTNLQDDTVTLTLRKQYFPMPYFYCHYLLYFSYCRQLKESLSFT